MSVNEISYVVTGQVQKQKITIWLDALGTSMPLHVPIALEGDWPHFANVGEVKKTVIAELSYYKEKDVTNLVVYKAGYFTDGDMPSPLQTGWEVGYTGLPDTYAVNDRTQLIVALDVMVGEADGPRACDFKQHDEEQQRDFKQRFDEECDTTCRAFMDGYKVGYKVGYKAAWDTNGEPTAAYTAYVAYAVGEGKDDDTKGEPTAAIHEEGADGERKDEADTKGDQTSTLQSTSSASSAFVVT